MDKNEKRKESDTRRRKRGESLGVLYPNLSTPQGKRSAVYDIVVTAVRK